MTSLLDSLFKWAKCKHDQLTVLGFLPDRKAYAVKCCKCGETRSCDVVQNKESKVLTTEEVKDYDPQY